MVSNLKEPMSLLNASFAGIGGDLVVPTHSQCVQKLD